MASYTVFAPPLKAGETVPNTDRFVFVRDGFHFWGMVFAPLWLLRYRLWLEFIAFLVVGTAIQIGAQLATGSDDIGMIVGILLAILIGLEGSTLRRWKYSRMGWRNVGVVVGDDREMAEQRFFDSWVQRDDIEVSPSPQPWTPSLTGSVPRVPLNQGVIGLFPEPRAAR